MSGYILNKDGIKQENRTRLYRQTELELMTTHQLREICREEKIIPGVLNPLDKEELIHVIMRYRGSRQQRLIREDRKEGWETVEQMFRKGQIHAVQDNTLHIPSKLIRYRGRCMDQNDQIFIPYREELEDTNAILVSGGREICGFFSLRRHNPEEERLYVIGERNVSCVEADLKEYDLYCFAKEESDRIYELYMGSMGQTPAYLEAYRIPLLDVEVRDPVKLRFPLVIDFGSTNTAAGVYLDNVYLEEVKDAPFSRRFGESGIRHVSFDEGALLLPSVAGVVTVTDGKPVFVYGEEAVRLSNACYVDEGFSIFYDMKRWISDYEKEEEITDRTGRRAFVKRRDILRSYFMYIVETAQDCFKCSVERIQISCPVKQKFLFQKLFQDILPEYVSGEEEMLDEGVSVLYNTISGMLEAGSAKPDTAYQALIVDCGGGTTDLCACRFRVRDDRVAYHIRIETSYENGDTHFGGNKLTYRIMQYMKIRMAEKLGASLSCQTEEILNGMDMDIYRYVDENGTESLYQALEEAYEAAETCIPTRFQEYELQSREDYFKVKNNFYHLFFLAEQVKKHFYEQAGVLRVGVSSEEKKETDISWVRADKWKLSVKTGREFQVCKEFPEIILNLYEIKMLLKGDIYGIVHKFLEPLYLSDKLSDFSFLKLTGQSCKIDLFRDALKEFLPGRMIQFKRRNRAAEGDIDLKLSCVDGALKYIRDKRLGYADIELYSDKPILPYTVSALTHNGREVELINGFLREEETRYVSRNLEDVTLQLFLKDTEGKVRYHFYFDCQPGTFRKVTYEEIREIYGDRILQKETDSIVNREARFFAWKRCREWGYVIVPVYRNEEALYLGQEQFYPFEHEGWVKSYFDGKK